MITQQPTHPPRTTQCTSTHPPTKPSLHTAEQQCSSTYSTAEQQCSSTYIRTAVQQYVHQYSNAAVPRAIHLTGEQQPICWLQCSRAGRDSPVLLGQAKQRSRCRFCARRAATAGRCCVWSWCCVLAVDAGALAISCP